MKKQNVYAGSFDIVQNSIELSELLNKIDEYITKNKLVKADLTIHINPAGNSDDYDDDHHFDISLYRQETDAEFNRRVAQEEKWKKDRELNIKELAKQREKEQKQLYLKLKKIYE